MRLRFAAASSAVVIMVGWLGGPVVPVMIGATVAYLWLVRRAVAAG